VEFSKLNELLSRNFQLNAWMEIPKRWLATPHDTELARDFNALRFVLLGYDSIRTTLTW